jgi:hypothetical protein
MRFSREIKVRGAMNKTPGPDTGGQPEPVRKPWHAPRFTLSELDDTLASTHAGTDFGPPGTNLS